MSLILEQVQRKIKCVYFFHEKIFLFSLILSPDHPDSRNSPSYLSSVVMSTTRTGCRRWYSIEYICRSSGTTALRDWSSSDTYFPTNTQAYSPRLDTNSHYWNTLYLKQDTL